MTESDWALEGKRALSIVVLSAQTWGPAPAWPLRAGKGRRPGAGEGHAWPLPRAQPHHWNRLEPPGHVEQTQPPVPPSPNRGCSPAPRELA